MKKKLLLLFVTIFTLSFSAFSQEEPELQPMFKTDFNFAGLGLSYEVPIAKKWTIDLSAGIGASANVRSSYEVRWDLNRSPSAYFKSEVKYNYNFKKRYKKGKNVANNSSNYLAFQTKYITSRFDNDPYLFTANNVLASEVHWGLQRSLGGNWLFNFHTGLGIAKDFDLGNQKSLTNLYLALGLKFSYKLF